MGESAEGKFVGAWRLASRGKSESITFVLPPSDEGGGTRSVTEGEKGTNKAFAKKILSTAQAFEKA